MMRADDRPVWFKFIAPSSLDMEPPKYPGRFSLGNERAFTGDIASSSRYLGSSDSTNSLNRIHGAVPA